MENMFMLWESKKGKSDIVSLSEAISLFENSAEIDKMICEVFFKWSNYCSTKVRKTKVYKNFATGVCINYK